MTKYPVQVTPTVTCTTDRTVAILFVMQHKLRHAIWLTDNYLNIQTCSLPYNNRYQLQHNTFPALFTTYCTATCQCANRLHLRQLAPSHNFTLTTQSVLQTARFYVLHPVLTKSNDDLLFTIS